MSVKHIFALTFTYMTEARLRRKIF